MHFSHASRKNEVKRMVFNSFAILLIIIITYLHLRVQSYYCYAYVQRVATAPVTRSRYIRGMYDWQAKRSYCNVWERWAPGAGTPLINPRREVFKRATVVHIVPCIRMCVCVCVCVYVYV